MSLSVVVPCAFLTAPLVVNCHEVRLGHDGTSAGTLGLLLKFRAETVEVKLAVLYLFALLEFGPEIVMLVY